MKRFWDKVEKADGCWEWRAARVRGYGVFRLGDRQVKAHRVAYELAVGEIPAGCQIHHTCENKGCVNPAHLEPLTPGAHRREHTADHCSVGHPLDGVSNRGWRFCRECHRRAALAHYHRRTHSTKTQAKQLTPTT